MKPFDTIESQTKALTYGGMKDVTYKNFRIRYF